MLPLAASEITVYRRFKFTRHRRGFVTPVLGGGDAPDTAGVFDPNIRLIRPSIIRPFSRGRHGARPDWALLRPRKLQKIIHDCHHEYHAVKAIIHILRTAPRQLSDSRSRQNNVPALPCLHLGDHDAFEELPRRPLEKWPVVSLS